MSSLKTSSSAKSKPRENSEPSLVLTPVMQQYFDLKAQNPEAILFFRMGDFYEVFAEDAYVGARELDITLTGRPEQGYPNGRIPMAGIPVKAYETYIAKLLTKGYSVAVAEQVGQVGANKGPVERQIVRILTPGTILESSLLPIRENNYLIAISRAPGETSPNKQLWGLAAIDASCGEFLVTQLNEQQLLIELARLNPREIIVAKKTHRNGPHGIPEEKLEAPERVLEQFRISGRPSMFFQLEPAKRRVMQCLAVSTLEGFGCQNMPYAIQAAGAALEYLEKTQAALMPKFTGISTYSVDDFMIIDENSRKNLEIFETVRERGFKGSLLWCIDRTQTSMGSRLLRNWLAKPLLQIEEINERLDAVEILMSDSETRRNLESFLAELADLERLGVKLSTSNLTPKDFVAISRSLSILPQLAKDLKKLKQNNSSFFNYFYNLPAELFQLQNKIENALQDDPPREITLGGIFCQGYSAELDEMRDLLTGGKEWVENFQTKEIERTQIKSLKVSYNSNFGYFIEITHANKDSVPKNYIRKQTLTNSERFITPELKEYESKILNAEKNQSEIEYKLFISLRNELSQFGNLLRQTAYHLACLDVLVSLASIANEYKYVRPEIDLSLVLDIDQGRHPVLERILPMGVYVANNTKLEGNAQKDQMIILTGPNMAGKSSLLRQVAHITILAQIGSFVPANFARIGLVDRIFTRIGAVDDLSQGQSTFLVEMSETTQCCLCATERSLILLDEVGRGTSTYDGVAIAWSVSEYLANVVKARTIFATHYHELNGLTNFIPHISNFQVQVAEYEGRVEFLHRVVPGGASRSFGIHVASMAGLPSPIIERAHQLMNQMERRSAASKILDGPKLRSISIDEVMQLSLFEN